MPLKYGMTCTERSNQGVTSRLFGGGGSPLHFAVLQQLFCMERGIDYLFVILVTPKWSRVMMTLFMIQGSLMKLFFLNKKLIRLFICKNILYVDKTTKSFFTRIITICTLLITLVIMFYIVHVNRYGRSTYIKMHILSFCSMLYLQFEQ